MDSFISLVTSINNFVWGPVMLVLLVGTGLYLNIILRFFSFRNWMHAFHCLWQGREHQSEKGEISPWNALMTALAGDIGTGNIVGVATALAIGGPGALFWMWVTALVGMMTKFAEIILAMKYREKTPSGRWVGGAMYFIRNGLGRKWAWMGVLFSVFGIIACVGTGNLVQVNAIAVSLQNTFSVPTWVTGIVLLFLLSLILLGGVKRIGAVAGRLVPFMAAIYIVFALIVIAMNITEVPRVFWWVISEAFTPTSAQGGFAGATVLLTIRMGVARGIFSNEAGLGTTPMAHAAATAKSPLQEASLGMLDVFIDTIVVHDRLHHSRDRHVGSGRRQGRPAHAHGFRERLSPCGQPRGNLRAHAFRLHDHTRLGRVRRTLLHLPLRRMVREVLPHPLLSRGRRGFGHDAQHRVAHL